MSYIYRVVVNIPIELVKKELERLPTNITGIRIDDMTTELFVIDNVDYATTGHPQLKNLINSRSISVNKNHPSLSVPRVYDLNDIPFAERAAI